MRLARLAPVAVAAALVAVPAPPASALLASGFVAQGSGVGDGLGAFTLTGTATAVGNYGIPATFPCTGSGTGLVAGSMTLGCGPVSVRCNVVEGAVAMVAQCIPNGAFGAYAGALHLRPHNVNPTTSFDFVGVFAGGSQP